MKMNKVLIAGALGFFAGILFAPKAGKETREELNRKMQEHKDMATDQYEHLKNATIDGLDSFKSKADKATRDAKDVAQSARTAASSVVGNAGDLKNEAKKSASSTKHDIDANLR